MSILDIVAGELPETKTHKSRRWTWVPCTEFGSVSAGVLTIAQGRRDCDSYDVAVDGREVLFAQKSGEAEVHSIQVHEGRPCKCSCQGWHYTKDCKHCHAVKALLAEGVIAVG